MASRTVVVVIAALASACMAQDPGDTGPSGPPAGGDAGGPDGFEGPDPDGADGGGADAEPGTDGASCAALGTCPDSGSCTPRSCRASDCGPLEDGCGGMIDCGECPCEPKSCAELHIQCGTADDGCGGVADCGTDACGEGAVCEANVCTCSADALEPNDAKEQATTFGELREKDTATYVDRAALNLDGTDDVDWYTAFVVDGWDWGNPEVHVRVTPTTAFPLEVTLYFSCASGTDAHDACQNALPYTDALGMGCQGRVTAETDLVLTSECDWESDESGTLFVRVRPAEDATACQGYSLHLESL